MSEVTSLSGFVSLWLKCIYKVCSGHSPSDANQPAASGGGCRRGEYEEAQMF